MDLRYINHGIYAVPANPFAADGSYPFDACYLACFAKNTPHKSEAQAMSTI
jgi:hypothetical protein